MVRVRLKVRELAASKGMSQRQLAIRTGIDINTIRRIFREPFASTKTETLGKIAGVLGVDASALIESVPDE